MAYVKFLLVTNKFNENDFSHDSYGRKIRAFSRSRKIASGYRTALPIISQPRRVHPKIFSSRKIRENFNDFEKFHTWSKRLSFRVYQPLFLSDMVIINKLGSLQNDDMKFESLS